VSSTAFSTELRPEPLLRIAVQLSGLTTLVFGLLALLLMPVGGVWRILASLSWLFFCMQELRIIRAAYSQYLAVNIDAVGEVRLVTRSGEYHAAVLLPGSVLLPSCAWLRFKTENGLVFGELMRGDSRESNDWRRLQVIWRHIGATS
jgi:hypothetical protein